MHFRYNARAGWVSLVSVFAASWLLEACLVAPCPEGRECSRVQASAGGAPAGGGTAGAAGNDDPGKGGTGNTQTGAGGQPLPSGEWVNVTSNLAGIESECGTLCLLRSKPDEDILIAGIAKKGLWSTNSGGDSWTSLGSTEESAKIDHRPGVIVFDPDHKDTWWEAGIYGGGAYKTTDAGKTFVQLGDIAHTDAISVDLTDPERKTMLLGGHEVSHKLYLSVDGGTTWDDAIGNNMPEGTCTNPFVLGPETFLVGCSGYNGGAAGILRSTNAGKTWTQVSELGGGQREPLHASDGTLYWFNTTTRMGMAFSKDDGETWEEIGNPDVRSQPVEFPDGRLAAIGPDRLIVSSDKGKTWVPASAAFPQFPIGVGGFTYSTQRKAFYVWHELCLAPPLPVPDDAVLRYDFDYETD